VGPSLDGFMSDAVAVKTPNKPSDAHAGQGNSTLDAASAAASTKLSQASNAGPPSAPLSDSAIALNEATRIEQMWSRTAADGGTDDPVVAAHKALLALQQDFLASYDKYDPTKMQQVTSDPSNPWLGSKTALTPEQMSLLINDLDMGAMSKGSPAYDPSQVDTNPLTESLASEYIYEQMNGQRTNDNVMDGPSVIYDQLGASNAGTLTSGQSAFEQTMIGWVRSTWPSAYTDSGLGTDATMGSIGGSNDQSMNPLYWPSVQVPAGSFSDVLTADNPERGMLWDEMHPAPPPAPPTAWQSAESWIGSWFTKNNNLQDNESF
jgi:hypothetical protein